MSFTPEQQHLLLDIKMAILTFRRTRPRKGLSYAMVERDDRLEKHVMAYLQGAQWEFKNKEPLTLTPPWIVRARMSEQLKE
jgi:hypothetical protein